MTKKEWRWQRSFISNVEYIVFRLYVFLYYIVVYYNHYFLYGKLKTYKNLHGLCLYDHDKFSIFAYEPYMLFEKLYGKCCLRSWYSNTYGLLTLFPIAPRENLFFKNGSCMRHVSSIKITKVCNWEESLDIDTRLYWKDGKYITFFKTMDEWIRLSP